jgi:hypothetical protein
MESPVDEFGWSRRQGVDALLLVELPGIENANKPSELDRCRMRRHYSTWGKTAEQANVLTTVSTSLRSRESPAPTLIVSSPPSSPARRR